MEDKHKNNIFSPKLIAAVAIIVLLGGSVTAWWASKSLQSSKSSPQTQTNSTPTRPENAENPKISAETENMAVYWLDDDLKLVAASVTVEKANNEEKSLENIFKVLLAGNPEGNNGTTIPEGTKLLKLKVEKDGIHLNLSQEFVTGGGSASMKGRLGQIIYTATSLDPNGEVWINVNGNPLEILGGEGLLVDQPMTRQLFEENFE
jgi:spore germination protein GerM